MKKTVLLPAVLALGLARPATAQPLSPIGVWTNPANKMATFEIFPCGKQLCGRFASVTNDPATKPRLDALNADPKLRGRSQAGLVFMQHFQPVGDNRWEDGKIHNFDDGKTYSCLLRMERPNELLIKGYIGFSLLGKSQTWTRLR